MIRIYKDNDTKVVTKGAYEQFYKSLGYNIILETVEEIKTESNDTTVEDVKETVSRPKKSSSNKRNKKED